MLDNTPEPIEKDGQIIGYIVQYSDEYWMPLDKDGNKFGLPSYKPDATLQVEKMATEL